MVNVGASVSKQCTVALGIRECMQESLAGSKVMIELYTLHIITYIGQPLVIAASRNHPLLDGVATVVD